jgi:MFS family permease
MLLAPGAFSAIILTFAGLWGVPFLVTQYEFTTRGAALMCSAMLVTWSAGSMAWGPLSQRIGRRKPVFAAGLAASMLLWSAVIFIPGLPRGALIALLLAISAAGGAFIVTFAFAKESVPARLGGTVSGIANMGVMLGGMLMQPLVGFMLDRQWDGGTTDGARVYGFAAFQAGFGLMLVWGLASLAMIGFARETHCRQMR